MPDTTEMKMNLALFSRSIQAVEAAQRDLERVHCNLAIQAEWLRDEIRKAGSQESSLQARIGRWQEDTFGTSQTIPGIDAHLVKEFRELLEATTNEAQREECADILMLLMGRAYMMGFDLMAEAERKLAINRKRTWGQPDAQGVIEHTRS